jgi:beta-galactosidase
MKKIILLIYLIPNILLAQNSREIMNFNANWQFQNQEDFTSTAILPTQSGYLFNGWKTVNLPHTAKIEPLVIVNPWQGISWYKKDFIPKTEWKNKKVFIEFQGVMQMAEVWLNGKKITTHFGGYTPITIDISKDINFDKTNRLIVKTDNHDNPEIPPGKPVSKLDFCYYSGIYRNVSLIVTNPLHITDAVSENRPANGGIRVWYPEVSNQLATIAIKTQVQNENSTPESFRLVLKLTDKSGKSIKISKSENQTIQVSEAKTVLQKITLQHPLLWYPEHPNLYKLEVDIQQNNKIIDEQHIYIGIRKFEIRNEQLLINGEPLLLIGTNRHQEYPYIGNALSDNAQYRDAVKIKQAGFNIIRLSHYPQSPAFMDACDELGMLTIAAIPGWQFVGDSVFVQRSYQDARDLIHRDQNHPSVVFWELSLNESPMPDYFMKKMNEIAREESPESKLITCGWINKFFDVWIPARQHAKFPNYWKKYSGKTPLFTGEYGDWEYFAQDAGLNQSGYAGLKSDERTSRQFRGDGEKRMLQQATNFQEAHNDNLRNPHLGDANWLMFDYNRGYSPDIEASGIMDIFRLPKFADYFYSSQREKPFLKISSFWNDSSDFHNLKVFSNCDEVALYLNDKLIERKTVERDNISDKLPHPPFIFHFKNYQAGTLKAVGFKNSKRIVEDIVSTSGKPAYIKLSYDRSGKPLKADGADVVFVYATICDSNGNPVCDSNIPVQFDIKGNGKLIGQNPIKAEAGIATILLQAGTRTDKILMHAKSDGLQSGKIQISAE